MPHLTAGLTLAVAPLPDPPLWQLWLFEEPLPGALLLLVLGMTLAIVLHRRGRKKLAGVIGSVMGLAAVGMLIVAAVVNTPRERILARTDRFVAAVQEGDTEEAGGLLDEEVEVRFGGVAAPGLSRASLLNVVHSVELRTVSIQEAQAVLMDDVRGRTLIRVRAQPAAGYPSTSWWRLDWRKNAVGGWTIEALDCVLFNGERPGPELAGRILRTGM